MDKNLKELQKIAAVCRKAGIKHYKCANFEIILTEEDPRPTKRSSTQSVVNQSSLVADSIETERLTEEQLLFYSTANMDTERLES